MWQYWSYSVLVIFIMFTLHPYYLFILLRSWYLLTVFICSLSFHPSMKSAENIVQISGRHHFSPISVLPGLLFSTPNSTSKHPQLPLIPRARMPFLLRSPKHTLPSSWSLLEHCLSTVTITCEKSFLIFLWVGSSDHLVLLSKYLPHCVLMNYLPIFTGLASWALGGQNFCLIHDCGQHLSNAWYGIST